MEGAEKQKDIESLKRAVEEAAGMTFSTDPHFKKLRQFIFHRTGSYISATTLKRIWGYLDEPMQTRESTLSLLALAVGYEDWDSFVSGRKSGRSEMKVSSGPKINEYINVTDDLEEGDRLLLYWYPERECEVVYLGNMLFEIVEAKKTKLRAGDRFTVHLIMKGQPLYLSNLTREGMKPAAYICGKLSGGVHYRLLD